MSPRYLGGKYRSRLHPQSRKCTCQFLWETGHVESNCTRPASSASRGENEVDHAVCLKDENHMHTVLSYENCKFYTTMIYPSLSRSVCISMGSPAWWKFGLRSSGSSLVSRWRDAPLVHARISNVTSRMLTTRSALISGASNAFLVIVINHIVKIVHAIKGPTIQYSKYLTTALLHHIFNSLQAPATACESQATACDIEINIDMLWIGVNCFFKENIFSLYWLIYFF